MSAFDGSAAYALNDEQTLPAFEPPRGAATSWSPAEAVAGSPAFDLQRRLHAAIVEGASPDVIAVPASEQLIRMFSRAAGYVSLAGAVGLIGYFAFG